MRRPLLLFLLASCSLGWRARCFIRNPAPPLIYRQVRIPAQIPGLGTIHMLYVAKSADVSSREVRACDGCRTILICLALSRTCGSFSGRKTFMDRRGAFDLLVKPRPRVSRPGTLELEHAERAPSITPCRFYMMRCHIPALRLTWSRSAVKPSISPNPKQPSCSHDTAIIPWGFCVPRPCSLLIRPTRPSQARVRTRPE